MTFQVTTIGDSFLLKVILISFNSLRFLYKGRRIRTFAECLHTRVASSNCNPLHAHDAVHSHCIQCAS